MLYTKSKPLRDKYEQKKQKVVIAIMAGLQELENNLCDAGAQTNFGMNVANKQIAIVFAES